MKEVSEMNLEKLIGTQQDGQKVSTSAEVEMIVNHIMKSLKASKTGWRVGFKTENEVNFYKQELLKACIENKIDSLDKIEIGLSKARKDESDFFPSVGKFINWCLRTDEHWEHKGAAYREWRPERLISSKTKEEQDAIAKKHLEEMRKKLRG